jgi:hypothetical protein
MHTPGRLFAFLFSQKARQLFEKYIIHLAIAGYLIHIAYLTLLGLLKGSTPPEIFHNVLLALYTPFSLILIFEVYLLVFYLPRSTTEYVAKEYEIIALIMIRRMFHDLGQISLTSQWFTDRHDLTFTVDLLATLLVFFLIWLFYTVLRAIRKYARQPSEAKQAQIEHFILTKRRVASLLLIVFATMLIYSIGEAIYLSLIKGEPFTVKYLSAIFFEDFFTVLIVSDVFLLLYSHYHTHDFHRVMRNSGYIISTVLIRLSFSAEGIVSSLLIVFAVAFSLVISWIYLQYEKQGFSQP